MVDDERQENITVRPDQPWHRQAHAGLITEQQKHYNPYDGKNLPYPAVYAKRCGSVYSRR